MKSQFEIWLEKVNEKRKKYWDDQLQLQRIRTPISIKR